jgi:hypothetical protein
MKTRDIHRSGGMSFSLGATLAAIILGTGVLAWEWHAAHPNSAKHPAAKVTKAAKPDGNPGDPGHHKHHKDKHPVAPEN